MVLITAMEKWDFRLPEHKKNTDANNQNRKQTSKQNYKGNYKGRNFDPNYKRRPRQGAILAQNQQYPTQQYVPQNQQYPTQQYVPQNQQYPTQQYVPQNQQQQYVQNCQQQSWITQQQFAEDLRANQQHSQRIGNTSYKESTKIHHHIDN